MSDFIVEHLTKSVGDKTVFRDISFIIHDFDRIGIIGVNGTGKTTLLDVISGRLGFDGDVSPFSAKNGYKIAYLTQEPEFDDNKGISLVLVNNEAGEKAFEKVKERLIWKQTKLEDSLQPPLKAPFPKPENREQFWSDFENKSFKYVAKKYGGIGLKNDARVFLRKIKRKIKKLVSKGGKRNTGTI